MKTFLGNGIGVGMVQLGSELNYKFIKIGTQYFDRKNLDIDITLLGNTIANVTTTATWITATALYDSAYNAESGTTEEKEYAGLKAAAMWKYYGNNSMLNELYGKWYNGYAIKLIQHDIDAYNALNPSTKYPKCTVSRWGLMELRESLGVTGAGGKLKTKGTDTWNSPNTGATNDYGFSLPGSGMIHYSLGDYFFKNRGGILTNDGYDYLASYNNADLIEEKVASLMIGYPTRLIKDVKPNSLWYEKKWSSQGDSISNFDIYQKIVLTKTKMVDVSLGISGTRISGTEINSMWEDARINAIPVDSDLITILGGTNDEGASVAIGTLNSTDVNTFIGAYNVMLTKIALRCPNAIILPMTTTFGYRSAFDSNNNKNNLGFDSTDYSQAIRDVCNNRGLKYIDLNAELGWDINNYTTYLQDGIHPNDKGFYEMSKVIFNKLKQVSPNL